MGKRYGIIMGSYKNLKAADLTMNLLKSKNIDALIAQNLSFEEPTEENPSNHFLMNLKLITNGFLISAV